MSVRLALITAGLSLLAPPATSAECGGIDNDLDRLACYDRESGRTPTAEVTEGPLGNWNVTKQTSEFEDTTDYAMFVESDEPLSCNLLGGSERARLYVRCWENVTSLFIVTNCHLASGFQGYGSVDYRVDASSSKTREFAASTDNKALGLWRGGDSIPVIKELIEGERVIFRFTPFNESPVSVAFSISGLEESIKPLRTTCGW